MTAGALPICSSLLYGLNAHCPRNPLSGAVLAESGKKLGVRRPGDARCRWPNSGEPIAVGRNGAPGPR